MKPCTSIWVALALLVVGGAVTIFVYRNRQEGHYHGASNERGPTADMKTIASAQADFRGNDRAGYGCLTFWREDIAGLYGIVPKGGPSGTVIELIPLSTACAYANPKTPLCPLAKRSPKAGYWYKALRYAGESSPDPRRFAACAYPEDIHSGHPMYLITEKNTLYRKECDATGPPGYCPENPEKEGWRKND